MSNRFTNRGIALLELILYVSLATILLSISALLYVVIIENNAKQNATMEVDRIATNVLLEFTQLMHDAESISNLGAGETAETLILIMKDVERSPATITLVNGIVRLQEGIGGPQISISASDVIVTNLSFQNLSATDSSVRVEFDARFDNSGGRNELEYADTYHATASTR